MPIYEVTVTATVIVYAEDENAAAELVGDRCWLELLTEYKMAGKYSPSLETVASLLTEPGPDAEFSVPYGYMDDRHDGKRTVGEILALEAAEAEKEEE